MHNTTDIITRLLGHSDHAGHCKHGIMTNGPGAFKRDECTCGYSAAIADAREFLEGESALNKMIVGLDIGDISHSSIVRVDYSSDGIPTYTPIPADEFYKLEGESDEA